MRRNVCALANRDQFEETPWKLDNPVLGSPRMAIARADLETEVFVKSTRSIEVICGEDKMVDGASKRHDLQISFIWYQIPSLTGMNMPKAELLIRQRDDLPNDVLIEIKIWQLPEIDPERPHGLKYSLYCGRHGKRLVGYDNERGKGDHRHIGDREESFVFVSMEQLIQDFYADAFRIIGELDDD